MRVRHFAIAAIATGALLGAGSTSPALAAGGDVAEATSNNWSGYVASGSQSGTFSSVSGSWVEPSVDCSSANGDAAFWVGLGGSSDGSGALEQVGTQVDCSAGGNGQHFTWYELVPAGPVRLGVPISPGDHVSAKVSVSGTTVTVSLSNQTTGASTTKSLEMDNPDLSSADWIAEAPSLCQGGDASGASGCTPVSLANFGTVTFTGASATADGSTDTISSSDWSDEAMQLTGDGQNASPSSLSSDGSSFSVAWQSGAAQSAGSSTDPGDPGSGYGAGGYGAGGGYGSYGPGAGYGGYGSGGYGGYGGGYGGGGYAGGYSYGGGQAGYGDPYSGYSY